MIQHQKEENLENIPTPLKNQPLAFQSDESHYPLKKRPSLEAKEKQVESSQDNNFKL
jgi:hypothetical protein